MVINNYWQCSFAQIIALKDGKATGLRPPKCCQFNSTRRSTFCSQFWATSETGGIFLKTSSLETYLGNRILRHPVPQVRFFSPQPKRYKKRSVGLDHWIFPVRFSRETSYESPGPRWLLNEFFQQKKPVFWTPSHWPNFMWPQKRWKRWVTTFFFFFATFEFGVENKIYKIPQKGDSIAKAPFLLTMPFRQGIWEIVLSRGTFWRETFPGG